MKKIKTLISKVFSTFGYRRRHISLAKFCSLQNVRIEDFVNLAHHCEITNSNVGKRSSIGRYTKINNAFIGKYCSISWDVTIGAAEHPLHAISTHAFTYRKQFGIVDFDKTLNHKQVFIGNDVWIGCNAILFPGIKIGDGAVIGAGAVVTKDVEPFEIVVGVPAKHLKYRFDEEVINKLMKIKWWDFSDSFLKKNIGLFSPENDITRDPNILLQLQALLDK